MEQDGLNPNRCILSKTYHMTMKAMLTATMTNNKDSLIKKTATINKTTTRYTKIHKGKHTIVPSVSETTLKNVGKQITQIC